MYFLVQINIFISMLYDSHFNNTFSQINDNFYEFQIFQAPFQSIFFLIVLYPLKEQKMQHVQWVSEMVQYIHM